MASIATYRSRPGRYSDLIYMASIYHAATLSDDLFDILFPTRHAHPDALVVHLHRLFQTRYWTPSYSLTVIVGEDDRPVGFSFWCYPNSSFSFAQRWLSPYSWFASFIRGVLQVRDFLFPISLVDKEKGTSFSRVLESIKPRVLNTDRRRQAMYLSTLAVHPKLQGRGLGSVLLSEGLQKAERQDKASWLIGLKGTESYYSRHGFVEVARANVGELASWQGGSIMFKE
ncbi:hypothetical protein B0I35DRAFT_457353 [Stachybotrys elegans]|uniref:N-acetyltransferase domain-containing protein n=1 Tax=Stachybotrys elegans TaxID=80388 RepID=A0A8K0WUT7_9HYPO|nr:hypothetical protein B0I35DRAFT_457353 [Stachybotrys elegans]